jgi:alkylation response protein AidB-like acyl-CoA dehydrogenase
MNATEAGRTHLGEWLDAQPVDLFADDNALGALVAHHSLGARVDDFHAVGQMVAGPLDVAARENNLSANLPLLDGWDAIGRQTMGVRHHPSYRDAGRLIYGTGIMAAYGEMPVPHRAILTMFYLTGQAGEAGHNCPLACAAGAIRTLQTLGTPTQKRRYLARLLDPKYDTNFTASQFLTEVQGGSDVGANALAAMPVSGGESAGSEWALSGEKWFCSNADADVFVVTARPSGAAAGTRGLGLFLVPRRRPDGQLNGFRIRRLKDKLGTRSMASAEIDFDNAYAEALGPVQAGFRHVLELVITTSRLFNAAGCAAHARRAWVIASTYAQHRQAFGQPIERFAQVRETLGRMRGDATASIAATLYLARILERIEADTATDIERALFRVGVNLNKLRTSVLAHETVNRGIEVLGGNGAIESFSVLPRLLRDNVVYENWEGTHNVLRAQVLRDCRRLQFHDGFFDGIALVLGESAVAADRAEMAEILNLDDDLAELRFRPLANRMATGLMLAALAEVPALQDAATMTQRHLAPLAIDDDYLALLGRLGR